MPGSISKTNEFAQQFLALRKARGLTQRAAADLLHTTVPTIQNWEQGRSTPWERYRAGILEQIYLVECHD